MCIVESMNDSTKMSKLASFLRKPNFMFNSLAERKIWLFWDNELTIHLVEEHVQCLSVDVSFLVTFYARCSFV